MSLAAHAGLALWTLICAFNVARGFSRSKEEGRRWHRRWGIGCCRLMDLKVQVEGLENWPPDKPVVIAPNHESMWDMPVLASLPRDFVWVSKVEMSRLPLFGPAMKNMGCYLIARDRSARDLNVMKAVEDGLRAGGSVVIFPEGTRTRTGELLPLKKGAFRTAQNAGVSLLPVGIVGAREISPAGHLLSRRGRTVVVRVGKPLFFPPDQEIAVSLETYRTALVGLLAHRPSLV